MDSLAKSDVIELSLIEGIKSITAVHKNASIFGILSKYETAKEFEERQSQELIDGETETVEIELFSSSVQVKLLPLSLFDVPEAKKDELSFIQIYRMSGDRLLQIFEEIIGQRFLFIYQALIFVSEFLLKTCLLKAKYHRSSTTILLSIK